MKSISIVLTILFLISLTFGTEDEEHKDILNTTHIQKELETKYKNVPADVKLMLLKKNAQTIIHTKRGLSTTILFQDGSFLSYGNPNYGGLIPYDIPMRGVKTIVSTGYAFAILCENGRVFAWGSPEFGGKIPFEIANKILFQNIETIVANDFAFAILTEDRSVLSWGHQVYGGNIPSNIQTKLDNVMEIVPKMIETSHHHAFDKFQTLKLSNNKIRPAKTGFTAKLENGNIYSWGL